MSDPITPRRVEWLGPEGFSVVLDEDGVQLRPSRVGLEECDLNRLLGVIAEAKRCRDAGLVPIPVVPYQARRLADVTARAIRAELGADGEDVPF